MSTTDTEATQINEPIAVDALVRVVDSGKRLRSRLLIGNLGHVVSGPVQWQNGQTYQVRLIGDRLFERTMFRDEITPETEQSEEGKP